MQSFDVLVVGAGFAGSVIAQELSSQGKRVLLIEKRPKIGGNMYDEVDEYGFLVQEYGPHILFTNEIKVVRYLSRFSDLTNFECHMLSFLDGNYVRLPFNFQSVQEIVGIEESDKIIRAIRENFDCRDRISIFSLMQSNNRLISQFAHLLFEKAFQPYICKQWGLQPSQIDRSIIDRVKFTPSYTSRYLAKDYQFLPTKGFTKLIESMVSNPLIEVVTGVDATALIKIEKNEILFNGRPLNVPLVYTGSIDELFGYCFGELPYRSLRFVKEYMNVRQALPCEIVSMPQDNKYNRKTEYKFFSPFVANKEQQKTIVVYEEPYQFDRKNPRSIRCYPIINPDNNNLYNLYKALADRVEGLYLCGRLAEYKYFNMDAVILHALETAKEILKKCQSALD